LYEKSGFVVNVIRDWEGTCQDGFCGSFIWKGADQVK